MNTPSKPSLPPPPPPGASSPGSSQRASAPGQGGSARRKISPIVIVAFVVGLGLVGAISVAVSSRKDSSSKTTVASKAAAVTTVAGASATAAAARPGEIQNVVVGGSGAALPKLGDNPAVDAAVGKTPPTLTGYGFDGTPVSITPGGGSPQLVLFVAHWCPHCQREVPKIVSWVAAGRPPKDLKISAVSTAVSKDAPNYPPSAWLSKVGFTAPVMADSAAQDAAKAWGLPGYPYFVLLKSDGTVASRFSGEIELDKLDELIATALGSR
jgi:cytochrome c biogenesis protein CcmG, thiol:disulfide interchange protein DsbE